MTKLKDKEIRQYFTKLLGRQTSIVYSKTKRDYFLSKFSTEINYSPYQTYNNPSTAKVYHYEKIRQALRTNDLRIISHNDFTMTIATLFTIDKDNTFYLRITKSKVEVYKK